MISNASAAGAPAHITKIILDFFASVFSFIGSSINYNGTMN